MNMFETIKLEPYEAPALEELELSVLHGSGGEEVGDSNPAGDSEYSGGDEPVTPPPRPGRH